MLSVTTLYTPHAASTSFMLISEPSLVMAACAALVSRVILPPRK